MSISSAEPMEEAAELIGQTLGRYRIEELLGCGGMAWVYRAWDQDLERDVAVKVISLQALEMDQSMERFHREARAVARLDHPHIVHVYDLGEIAGQPYMVMQYIPGPNLEDRLHEWSQRGRLLAQDDVLTILRQVAAALDYAHEQGLVHRDVKPSNVLFKEPGHAVLTDFGVARLHTGMKGQHPTLTDADQVLGTPTYMAPEQATRTIPTSAASDVYSLAVVAYEMLSGQPPFEADSTLSAILQHILEAPPSIRERRPDLPLAVDQVLQRALDKDPARRFPTATDFVDALEATWKGEQPEPAPVPVQAEAERSPPTPDSELPVATAGLPAASSTRRVSWKNLGIGVVLIGGIIVALLGALLVGLMLLWWASSSGLLSNLGTTSAPSTPPTVTPTETLRASPTVVLTPAKTAASLTYRAVYEGNREAGGTFIRGRVTDRDGQPVSGALVELFSPGWTWLRTVGTGTDGSYEFIVSPDSYYLQLKNRPSEASPRVTVKYSQEAIVNWVEGE